jgi:ABC-2 type transport system ATP-binding protein
MTTTAIEVRGLRKSYGGKVVLDDVDLTVGAGTVTALLGPNGAGKTTTVHILSTLLRPDGGTAFVNGCDVVRDPGGVRAVIGLTGQFSAVDKLLTGEENLLLMARLRHLGAKRSKTRVAELLEQFDLVDAARKPLATYSGGMQRRLDLAMTLVATPSVIFLDEPTTGLDPAARRSLWEVVRDLRRQGKSVLLTTHYMEEAEVLCDRLAIMDHGKLLDMGTVQELVSRRFHERAVHFERIAGLEEASMRQFPGVSRVAHEDGEVLLYTGDVPATIGAVLAAADALGVQPRDLSIRRASLEDVFLDLTGHALRD